MSNTHTTHAIHASYTSVARISHIRNMQSHTHNTRMSHTPYTHVSHALQACHTRITSMSQTLYSRHTLITHTAQTKKLPTCGNLQCFSLTSSTPVHFLTRVLFSLLSPSSSSPSCFLQNFPLQCPLCFFIWLRCPNFLKCYKFLLFIVVTIPI